MRGPTTLGPQGTLRNNAVHLISKFMMENQELGTMRSLSETMPLPPHQGDTVRMTTYARFKAQRLMDIGMDVTTAQALTDEDFTISSTGAAIKAEIPEIYARRAADPNIFGRAGQLMNIALKVLQDQDGCDQLAVYPQLGANGANLTPGLVASADTLLGTGGRDRTLVENNVEPAEDDRVGVFHPYALHILAGRLAPISTTPGGAAAYDGSNGGTVTIGNDAEGRKIVARGMKAMGTISGIKMHRNANIIRASNEAVGAIYSRQSLKYLAEVESSIKKTTDDSALRTELFSYYYGGWGIYKPTLKGYAIKAAAAVPTG